MPPALVLDDADLVGDALDAARARFAPEMDEIVCAIRAILAGRDPCELTGRECLDHLELRQRFLEIAADQAAHAEMHLLAHGRPRIAA